MSPAARPIAIRRRVVHRGMRAHLTANLIEALPDLVGPEGALTIRDTVLPGFLLRARPSGRHTWAVELGRGYLVTIGPVSVLSAGKARKAAQDHLAKRSLGELRPRGQRETPTLRTYLEGDYLAWARLHLRQPDAQVQRIRAGFPDLLDVKLSDITAFAVERWRSVRLKGGAKPTTANNDLSSLKSVYRRALADRLLATSPLRDVKLLRVDSGGIVRYLSADEETRLRDALVARDDERRAARERANVWRRERHFDEWPAYGRFTDHVHPLVLLSINTGLRRGEAFNLRWRDVELGPAPHVTIQGAGAKSGQTRRVPLNIEAHTALVAWQPSPSPPDAYVFPAADGGRLDNIQTAWEHVMKAARITRFRWHDLRHHAASKMAMANVSLNVIREILGHKGMEMTMRYSHLGPEHLAAAVATLGKRA